MISILLICKVETKYTIDDTYCIKANDKLPFSTQTKLFQRQKIDFIVSSKYI